MKTIERIKTFFPRFTLVILAITIVNPIFVNASSNSNKVIYPLKEVSKLECRFKEFKNLGDNCKQQLPILNTKDYKKYSSLNGGYNDYTRLYTVLWGASYKYGWDVGNGGHIGTDIATAKGTPVYAMADGKIINAKNDIMEGNMISIEHYINGKYVVSNYLHLSKMLVKKGDIIKVGTKIGEVGSTGNSTGNHLHFQIDLKTPFHPYYYDYNKCPFNYYKITEDGVCFDELAKNTIDPLLFLETHGAILDKVNQNTYKYSSNISNTTEDLSIFNRTVYIGYSISDIKKVQEIYKVLGYYNGAINGNYTDVEKSVINYQLKNKLIENVDSYGAGWFGPKTRYQTKKDYLTSGKKINTNTNNKETTTKNTIKTIKIERKNLLSREEIEKMEVDNFLRKHKIEFTFVDQGTNIKKNGIKLLKLKITDYKGRLFKGDMPGSMTFIVNTEKVSVFPKKLFYFTDGKRDIKLTGISEGSTNLYIKIGNVTVKTFNLKVYNSSKTVYPDSAKILSSNRTTLGENKTGIVLFKDNQGKNLINLPYGSTFNIKATGNNKICIKRGNLKNIRAIYKSKCNESDYKNEFNFKYKDTVGGLLIYNFKATDKNFKITIKNNYNNKIFTNKTIAVVNPKLNRTYAYTNEIIDMLSKGIVNGVKNGYFLESRGLSQKDAFNWTKNALLSMKNKSYSNNVIKKIETNISEINKTITYSSKYKYITRKEFLDITYKYLVINTENNSTTSYRDIDKVTNNKVSNIFNENITWKDKFGKKYFRPDEKITRGEGVYFLAQSLNRTHESYLTYK